MMNNNKQKRKRKRKRHGLIVRLRINLKLSSTDIIKFFKLFFKYFPKVCICLSIIIMALNGTLSSDVLPKILNERQYEATYFVAHNTRD